MINDFIRIINYICFLFLLKLQKALIGKRETNVNMWWIWLNDNLPISYRLKCAAKYIHIIESWGIDASITKRIWSLSQLEILDLLDKPQTFSVFISKVSSCSFTPTWRIIITSHGNQYFHHIDSKCFYSCNGLMALILALTCCTICMEGEIFFGLV